MRCCNLGTCHGWSHCGSQSHRVSANMFLARPTMDAPGLGEQ